MHIVEVMARCDAAQNGPSSPPLGSKLLLTIFKVVTLFI